MKQTWYQFEGSKVKEFITILHIPYTLMCLSFLTIGFFLSSLSNFTVYILTIIAYFFGLGISAHSFDQLTGMGSKYVKHLTDNELIYIGIISLLVSIGIGINIMFYYSLWHLIWLIPLQSFFVLSYPISKLFKGEFHSDFWFAVSFGFLPVVIGNYINTSQFSLYSFWWGMLALIIAFIEILLSRHSRNMRKEMSGKYANDKVVLDNIIYYQYIEKPEKALKLLCVMTYLLAFLIVIRYYI